MADKPYELMQPLRTACEGSRGADFESSNPAALLVRKAGRGRKQTMLYVGRGSTLALFMFVLMGCTSSSGLQNPLANLNSGSCGTLGATIGLIASPADAVAPTAGSAFGAAVCYALAGFFTQPNTLTGSVQMPIAMKGMVLTAETPPQPFVCPANMTCTPK